MIKYIMKRLAIAVITLIVIVFILYLMLQLMPGTPFNDEKLTEAQMAIVKAKYGLDKPFLVQFFNYLKLMLQGDFGVSYSIQKNMPVSQMLDARLWISIRIGLQAVVVGVVLGLVLGITAALKKKHMDRYILFIIGSYRSIYSFICFRTIFHFAVCKKIKYTSSIV